MDPIELKNYYFKDYLLTVNQLEKLKKTKKKMQSKLWCLITILIFLQLLKIKIK